MRIETTIYYRQTPRSKERVDRKEWHSVDEAVRYLAQMMLADVVTGTSSEVILQVETTGTQNRTHRMTVEKARGYLENMEHE